MKVFAYCTESARWAVGVAAGTEPLTSPPMRVACFDPQWMEGYDVLYFRLHGMPGSVSWYGDGGLMALAPVHVSRADLSDVIVVAATCYGASNARMVDAFYEAGARAVIAGPGPNLAAANRIVGADLLLMWMVRALRLGLEPGTALDMAKLRMWLTGWRRSDRDAAQFGLIEGGSVI